MAELATIARPYAEAAFEIARDANALGPWSEMLGFASQVVSDPRVGEALDNPRLDAAARESLLLSIAGDRLNGEVRNFIRVLVEAERVALLPQIAAMFDTLKNEAESVAIATIESAFELTPAQVDELKTALEKRFGKKIEATVTINPTLIGGARITVGDSVLDGSVQAKLDAMRTALRA
ncbi:MAG TPA: F0F1 ATP synthase subunit delta [Casimicrobiaceae bacterium]|nr:F0F1 ATP synthase subunit delta [Casimicrobiaceae bacterium]